MTKNPLQTRTLLLASALAAALFATACANDDTADLAMDDDTGIEAVDDGDLDGLDPADGSDTETSADATGASGSAEETIALLTAIDQHEIDAAEQAREKGVDGDVLAYADMLLTEHTANLEKDREVAEAAALLPATTDAVEAQKQKGKVTLVRLSQQDAAGYAEAWVDAMVQGHEEAVQLLGDRIESTSDPQLLAHLIATREVIEGHLEHGKALQEQQ